MRTDEFWTEVVHDVVGLTPHLAAWEDLCAHAIEVNPWYEPFFLQAGLKHLASPNPLSIVFVYRKAKKPKDPPLLCGVFPFEKYRLWSRLPLYGLRLWRNEFVCLNTPPVRQGYAPQVLQQMLDWALTAPHGAVYLDLPHLDTRGPFQEALVDLLHDRQIPSVVPYCYNRALLAPTSSAEEYLETSMTCHNRQELRRQRRRLTEQGPVVIQSLQATDSVDAWMEQFFELEARGWKGESGGAIARDDRVRSFFLAIARELHARQRLMMLRLSLDDKPIAMKFNFTAGEGSFAFKICFDEAFSKFSPGVQLEVENVEQVHARKLRWMDSCAKPGHFMISRLWRERRTIHRVLIPISRTGSALLGLFPLARSLRHAFKRPATVSPSKSPAASPSKPAAEPTSATPGSPMRSLVASEAPIVVREHREQLLKLDEAEFLAKFHKQPFLIQHDLCQHPLFALPRILELARSLPETNIEYNAGNLPVNQDQSQTPRNGLSVEETIRRIEECKSWMVLKSVEADPEYKQLLHDCLAQVKPLSDVICPGMMHAQAFIFLTSPNSVTPYHIDPEHNFLLQIRGSKKVSLFDGRDRTLLTDEDLEKFYGGRVRNMTLPDSHRDRAWQFNLKEGFGLHFPVTYPHWVQNGNEVSISFSITFRTPDLERRRMIYSFNRLLRARGLSPLPPGRCAIRDALKYQSYRLLRKVGAKLGRDW